MNFNKVEPQTSKEEILLKISEYDIFKRYCSNFRELNVSFISDLRVSDSANCRIHINDDNQLRYKDFKDGTYLDCWNYVMKKFNCHYYEALNIIANDFNIKHSDINISPKILTANDEFKIILNNVPREKSIINVITQPFNLTDFNYWNQYKIPLELLQKYNVFSAKNVYLIKGNKRIIFEYSKSNPCYAYRFSESGKEYSYKIYWPMTNNKKYKWLFSGGANNVEGLDQLPLHGDLLILTKSLKDCMCYNVLDVPAISLQGESNKLDKELVAKLLKRFNKIIINYDGDDTGVAETNKLNRQYGFDYFYIDEYKDLSDYIKNKGLDEAKHMIYNKIRKYENKSWI